MKVLQKPKLIGVVTVPGNIPGLYIQKVLNVMARQGKDVAGFSLQSKLLQNLPTDTVLAETEFTHEEYSAFIKDVLENFDIPGLGLRVGRRFLTTDFGILGYAFLSARNFEFALQLAVQYQQLWGGGSRLVSRLSVEDKLAFWEEHSSSPPGRLQQYELEEAVAQFLSSQKLLANPDEFKLLKVQFSFDPPDYPDLFEETFKCPVEFGQPNTRIYFPANLLDAKLSASNELAQEICEKQCRKLLRILEDRGGLTEKIKAIILNSPGEIPPLQVVANSMNMSLRTIRRRLKAEGTTYKELLASVRMKVAKQYLQETPLSIKEIGYLLCYSEVANFQRAFKNWFNTTPRKMREEFQNKNESLKTGI